MVAVFVVWAHKGGTFNSTVWTPGALFALGLLLAVLVGTTGAVGVGSWQSVAVLALVGFASWSHASILWADVPGTPGTGANRTALCAAVFALFLLLPWTPRAAAAARWLFVAGVTTVCAIAIYRVLDDRGRGRIAPPTGYGNANVALFMCAFRVALALGDARRWWSSAERPRSRARRGR